MRRQKDVRSRIRSLMFGATVVTVAVTVALLAAEQFVRWSIPAYDPSGHVRFVTHPKLGVPIGEPNTTQHQIKNTGDFDVLVRFNQYGLRDDRDVAAARDGDYLLAGDSLGFGWGVAEDDRASEQLETLLGARVFNISMLGDLDSSRVLIEYAESLGSQARDVILIFSMEARLRDYDSPPPLRDSAILDNFRLIRAKIWLMSHSALYYLVTSFVHRSPAMKAAAIRFGLIQPNEEGFPTREYDPAAIHSTANRVAALAKRWKLTTAVAPSRALWIGPTQQAERRIHRAFVSALVERGLKAVDLADAFETEGRPLAYFFANDGHWNPAGHRLAASTIARYIKSQSPGSPTRP